MFLLYLTATTATRNPTTTKTAAAIPPTLPPTIAPSGLSSFSSASRKKLLMCYEVIRDLTEKNTRYTVKVQ